jgi:hypothetical protein
MEALIRYRKDGSISKMSGKWYYWVNGNKYKKTHYAMNGDRRKSIHRLVTNAPKGMDVDHINNNGLDNRKENLRICTRSQNSMNRKPRFDNPTGYKGVQYTPTQRYKYTSKKTGITTVKEHKVKNPYRAYLGDGKGGHLQGGRYATAEEAARARDLLAVKMHGEFVYLNFPERLEEYMAELNIPRKNSDSLTST